MGGETEVIQVMGKGGGCAMCDKGRARWCSSGGSAAMSQVRAFVLFALCVAIARRLGRCGSCAGCLSGVIGPAGMVRTVAQSRHAHSVQLYEGRFIFVVSNPTTNGSRDLFRSFRTKVWVEWVVNL
jgi:hypothetical protein